MYDINTRILITGAAGFIGSNLSEYFLNIGYDVTGLDNYATGKEHNIDYLKSFMNFTFINGDIRNIEDCHKACANKTYVLHQAALGSVPRSIKDPITSNDVNVSGYLNMLVACRDAGVKKMVYAASSSTYGDSNNLPKVEHIIGNPLSPYAITKYVNELYATVFKSTYNFDTIGLRYFNVYGRRQDSNGAYAAVIPKFIKSLMDLESPTINGDGTFSRDFTYIDNVIQANELAMLTDNEAANNQIYNVACGDRTTLNQLIDLLKNELATYNPEIGKLAVNHGPNRVGDIPHSLASIEKAQKLLNYNPQYNMADGIRESIKWYKENL